MLLQRRWHVDRFTPTCVGTMHDARVHLWLAIGSPPRAWGQSIRASTRTIFRPVHPHVRGDNMLVSDRTAPSVGSPPRAWGQSLATKRLGQAFRFTPTCVGTIENKSVYFAVYAVHPHVRGDNGVVFVGNQGVRGSPPRAWGQLPCVYRTTSPSRFTPTCVGTIVSFTCPFSQRAVHPHVRGDNVHGAGALGAHRGSPPRAWGQYMIDTGYTSRLRFTPTCVGTISTRAYSSGGSPVHPHVRGDNRIQGGGKIFPSGSPPRAWGQLQSKLEADLDRRFTPTCVGTMIAGSIHRRHSPVHPHVRGDNESVAVVSLS